MLELRIFADFLCPYSALANYRVHALELAYGRAVDVQWRAICAPRDSLVEPLEARIAGALDLLLADEELVLDQPNDGYDPRTLSRSFASLTTREAEWRMSIFAAVWQGTAGDAALIPGLLRAAHRDGTAVARGWHREFERFHNPSTPVVVVGAERARAGIGGLKRLANLLTRT